MTEVTVVGAGGIGCALAHALAADGLRVAVVEADPAKLERGRVEGIAVDDEPPRRVEMVGFEAWRPAADEPVLLATKCYDNVAVLDRLPAGAELVPVQNGFDRRLVERVAVEGIASFVSECERGRAHTRITRPGELHLGWSTDDRGPLPARIERLVRALERRGRFTVRRVPVVRPYKYTKLMYNAAISPVAAVAGLDNGELLTRPRARRLFFGLLRENYRILVAAGAPLARVGPFHPDTVDRILRLPLLARLMAVPFARTLRGTYCSMAGDLPGGPTELDNYNGHLLELAGDLPVPLNRAVYRWARAAETNRLEPSVRRLDELDGG